MEPEPSLLTPGDGWSHAVADSGALGRTGGGAALRSFLNVAVGPRPLADRRWTATANLLASADRSLVPMLRTLVETLAAAVPRAMSQTKHDDARPILVSSGNMVTAVNTVWAAAHLLGAMAVPDLGTTLCRLLEEPWTAESTSLRDACAGALAAVGTQEAFEQLREAIARAQTKAQRELLLLCIGRMPWAGAGVATAELAVPTHGLDVNGKCEITTHHRTSVVTLREDGSVSAESLDDADMVRDEVAERVLGGELRAIRATYRKEAERIEALLASERTWTLATWRRLYLDHPITRAVASRLVWRLEVDDASVSPGRSRKAANRIGQLTGTVDVIPAWNPPGILRAANARAGDAPWPEGSVTVRLWHPREAHPEDLAAWRRTLRQLDLRQPFPQIERDFTVDRHDPDQTEFDQLAGSETDTASWEAALSAIRWSPRNKAAGKTADRGDFVDRVFPDDGVTATAVFTRTSTPASADADAAPERIRLGTAWIHRTDDRTLTPLPWGALPARLTSEVARDLSLLMRTPTDAVGGPADDVMRSDGPADALP
jgi:hypothetical protein